MFKFKSYNVKKVSKKNEKEQTKSSFSTGTLKKSSSSSVGSSSSSSNTGKKSSSMTLAKKEKIKSANNKESPEYSRKVYPKKTVTTWKKNETFSPKNEPSKTVIPKPHKKLERK